MIWRPVGIRGLGPSLADSDVAELINSEDGAMASGELPRLDGWRGVLTFVCGTCDASRPLAKACGTKCWLVYCAFVLRSAERWNGHETRSYSLYGSVIGVMTAEARKRGVQAET